MKKFTGFLRNFFISEKAVIAMILINATAIFLGAAFTAGSLPDRIISHVDLACVIFFLIEAIIKIRNYTWKEYWQSGWNRFDFIIVVLSLPVLLEPFVSVEGFSIILVIRLGRLFRLFRIMYFIPNIDHLANGISRALKASVGVFIALFIVNVIFALGGTILFGDIAPEYFGNPPMSIYSTFKVFTVEGWYEIPDVIAARSDSDFIALAVRIYFIAAVVVGGLLGLSLANAIFIDEMTADNNDRLEKKIDSLTEEVKKLTIIIYNYKRNGSGDPG